MSEDPAPEAKRGEKKTPAALWVSSTYFAEGFPYSVVNNLAEVLYEQLGASLQAIGLTSLFHVPWNLKFLWGPFIDHYETKRRWLVGVEVFLTVLLFALAFVVSAGKLWALIGISFLLIAITSATHDIAIDGYYLEALDDERQAAFVGFRAMAFRAATLLIGGPLLWVIGKTSWAVGMFAIAGIMALVTAVHVLVLPEVQTRARPIRELVRAVMRARVLAVGALLAALVVAERRLGVAQELWAWVQAHPVLGKVGVGGWIGLGLLLKVCIGIVLIQLVRKRIKASTSDYAKAFVSFFEQDRVGLVLLFVITFRTGESFLQKMRWPFLHKELGLELGTYGIANGTIGLAASFVATMVGGWLISRHGLRRWIWPFVVAQNGLNLLYVWLAATETQSTSLITAVITAEHFGAGLGTAVFMVYLMRCCDSEHKAAHFAILSALMSVGFTLAGVTSGFLAEAIGFRNYFLFTVVACLPSMALIPFIPHVRERPGDSPDAIG